MNAYIGNTDYDWYRFLSGQQDLEEVNFWRPVGGSTFKALRTGEPFFFKLKARHDHAICGFGLFVLFKALSVLDAWSTFTTSNGTADFSEMMNRVAGYTRKIKHETASRFHTIGCILLATPIFFPEELWIRGPSDWHPNIVSGKGYSTTHGEGKRIWNECIERTELLSLPSPTATIIGDIRTAARYGRETIVRPRLGQGTFRYVVENAYQQCAITREHSLPALEAAHIMPYADGGVHDVTNGLLLRADIHKLHDKGFVAVTPDYKFRVSEALDEQYHNGKEYYRLDDSQIWLPSNREDHPSKEFLDYHMSKIFRG